MSNENQNQNQNHSHDHGMGKTCDCSGGCCGGCHTGMGMGMNRYHIARWIVGILLLGLVFAFGVKIGEFKALLEGGRGYHSTRMMNGYNGGMMQNQYYNDGFVPGSNY